jgi:RHS repeat-associated protein
MFPSTKNTTSFWYSKNVKVEEKMSYPFGSYPKPQISDLEVWSAYPFGSILSSVSKGVYRYGFNGKETDSETDLQDYGERIYNSSIAKFLSADPLIVKGKQYPWYSPYHFAGNTPISAIDLDGLEEFVMTNYTFKNSRGNTVIYKIDWIYIKSKNRIINQPDGTGNYYFLEKNRTSPKPSGLAKHVGVFTKGWFNRNRDNIIENNKTDFSYSLVLDAKKRAVSDSKGNFSGSFLTLNSAVLHFDPDHGRTIDQVQSKFDLTSESFKEGFDNLAGLLIHDPNSIIHITGVANTTATNIGGEQSENTVNNNLILAQQRAEAGKSFLLEYIKEKYNIERLPDRIETNSKEGQSENKIVFKTVLND